MTMLTVGIAVKTTALCDRCKKDFKKGDVKVTSLNLSISRKRYFLNYHPDCFAKQLENDYLFFLEKKDEERIKDCINMKKYFDIGILRVKEREMKKLFSEI